MCTFGHTKKGNMPIGYYNITVDCSIFLHDDYGLKNVTFSANKTYYENSTLVFNFNVVCLTAGSLINLTQYGQILVYNGSGYQAFLGENVTIYMNYTSLNTPDFVTDGVGKLTFNSIDYYDYDLDSDGIYAWEIDVESLSLSFGNSIDSDLEVSSILNSLSKFLIF